MITLRPHFSRLAGQAARQEDTPVKIDCTPSLFLVRLLHARLCISYWQLVTGSAQPKQGARFSAAPSAMWPDPHNSAPLNSVMCPRRFPSLTVSLTESFGKDNGFLLKPNKALLYQPCRKQAIRGIPS